MKAYGVVDVQIHIFLTSALCLYVCMIIFVPLHERVVEMIERKSLLALNWKRTELQHSTDYHVLKLVSSNYFWSNRQRLHYILSEKNIHSILHN
jgi:hypothetical protein